MAVVARKALKVESKGSKTLQKISIHMTPLEAVQAFRHGHDVNFFEGSKSARILSVANYPFGMAFVIILCLTAHSLIMFIPFTFVMFSDLIAKITKTGGSSYWQFHGHLFMTITFLLSLFLYPETYFLILCASIVHVYSGSYIFGSRRGLMLGVPLYVGAVIQYILLSLGGNPPTDVLIVLGVGMLIVVMVTFIMISDIFLGTSLIMAQQEQIRAKTLADELEVYLQNAGEGIIATDKFGVVVYTNVRALEAFGLAEADLHHKNIAKESFFLGMNGTPLQLRENPISIVLTSGKQYQASLASAKLYFVTHKHTQEMVPVGFTVSPVVTDGNVEGSVTIIHDIRSDIALDQAKTEFVSLASHQLRTPMTTIRWYSERMLKKDAENLTEKQQETMQEVLDATQRVMELINDLLNVSRAELGTINVVGESVDVLSVFESVYKSIENSAKTKGLSLYKHVHKDQHIMLENSDKAIVNVVIENLFTNAIKYTDHGTITADFEIIPASNTPVEHFGEQLRAPKGGVLISVHDTGIGIPDDQKPHIFQKLFRASNVKTINVSGTGLGMYLSQQFARAMGGVIWFESTLGRGSHFHVFLPSEGSDRDNTKTKQ